MWNLTTPWEELILRGTIMYFFMFILMRIWGKKHLAEVTAFDFILLLFISEAVQNSLISDEKSVFGGMIVISTFLFWSAVINKVSYRWKWFEKVMNGLPKVIVQDGRVIEKAMQQEEITEQELYQAIREEGVFDLKDVKLATVETNGHISVIQNH